MGKKLVKQDINCLEYPLWFQDNRSAEHHETGYTWNNAKGFVVSTNFKPPVKTDIIFLFYLLNKSQEEGWKDEIRVTRYQVIKECGLAIGALWYKRLEETTTTSQEIVRISKVYLKDKFLITTSRSSF